MNKRISAPDIRARKGGTPISALTAYTTPFAKILDNHLDILLVGDSLGMVLYGMESTLGVTLEMMIQHGKAVMRGSQKACVIVDMPFASYQESPQQAFRNAAKILSETGCQGVKMEGGKELAETIRFLTQRGIPVMGHIGLMPQHINSYGGFKYQGRDAHSSQSIVDDALAVEKSGAFSMVLEGTAEPLAKEITARVSIPVIGIGASPTCDGQVLVTEDMLGLFSDYCPRFVKKYNNLSGEINKAVEQYVSEVQTRQFPDSKHLFGLKPKLKEIAEG